MAQILIVEDEASIRKFVMMNLAARGHQVWEASTATDGLMLLRRNLPGLMLLDIKLPDFNGWELLNRVLDDPELPKVTVIVLTASIMEGPPDHVRYPGLYQVLTKPISVGALLRSVDAALLSEDHHDYG